jgi:hypothetical protein
LTLMLGEVDWLKSTDVMVWYYGDPAAPLTTESTEVQPSVNLAANTSWFYFYQVLKTHPRSLLVPGSPSFSDSYL